MRVEARSGPEWPERRLADETGAVSPAAEVPAAEDVRAEVTAWLAQAWDPDRSLLEWRALLVDSGWGCPSWPADWHGRGLPPAMDAVVAAEFERVGAVGVASGIGMYLVAPTLLSHGSDELRRRFLRPILTGEHSWCQLFSEPGSGSDLAGLTTRAVLDGDEWVVNGQKVWNSGAHRADYGILLARTDWETPKHQGITYLLLPMRQPGVEVRPLRQMNGHASFNEVFLTDARAPADFVVDRPGDGWRVALTTLAHERSGVATRRPRFREDGGRTVAEARAEAEAYFATYSWYPQRAGGAHLIRPEAARTGRAADPLVRQALTEAEAWRRTTEWTTRRARAARAAGRPPGPEGSLAKLASSAIARHCHDAHTAIAGSDGMLNGPDAPAGGLVAEVLVSTPAMSIAGGTDEIQHNIIGERVLGLPREPDPSKDVPFREVPTNR